MKHVLRFVAILGGIALLGATADLKTYTTGKTWVTEYLEKGGDIKNITGLVQPPDWKKNAVFDEIKPTAALPTSWDWRSVVQLQPVRNQASCGSCWAFAITATIESLMRLLQPMSMDPDYAEQTLVSSCESGGSCAGGYFSAFNYTRDKGLPDEAQDPYLARNSSCKSGLISKIKVTSWAYVGNNPTTAQIKQAIYDHGPVTVDVNGSFGNYTGGIYNGCGSTGTNHMVTLLGWVDDPAYARNGGGYWIMRNSWGTNWGEAGFMRIVYKSTGGRNCNGIGNTTAYAVLNNVQNVRQHLGLP